ncbi:MAG: transporter substrate-binding domain-containing protein [Proteobacteria bacterium]|nr:transporter substrate-binding domain-containing protein [Pseudomonadota bacterium]
MPPIRRRDALSVLAASGLALARPSRAQGASTWDQIAASGTLRMGLIPGRAPYQWLEDGKVKGFIDTMSRDCAAKLSAKMGKPIAVEYVTTTNQTTILDLQANRMDAFIPLTVTPERRAAIDMFEPLYLMPVVAFNRKGFDPGPNWEDYNKPGTRIAVVMGTTDELAARRRLTAATIRSLKSTSEAILEVQAGHSDAVVMGLLLGLVGVKNNGNLGAITLLQPLAAPPSGGGTRKDGDGRFAAFMQEWTTGFHDAGGSTSAILAAMKEAGLDVGSIPAGVKF